MFVDFCLGTMESRRYWKTLFKVERKRILNPEFYIQGKNFRNESKIKIFSAA